MTNFFNNISSLVYSLIERFASGKNKIYPKLFTKHLEKYHNQVTGHQLRYFADIWQYHLLNTLSAFTHIIPPSDSKYSSLRQHIP